jgi:DNA-binding NarL/FixJ family response regulator
MPAEPSTARPIAARGRQILESVLRGHPQKNISYDLALAPSTVTLIAQRAMLSIGSTGRPSRANPLLMLAASAAVEQDDTRLASLGLVMRAGLPVRVISIARPDLYLIGRLPGAELDIVKCLLEGHSHACIARRRGTSQRTIANQIASVFRRLNVSSRAELVHRLAALSRLAVTAGAGHLSPQSCDVGRGAVG